MLIAVTKSGGNEFSGSAFFDYTSDSLRANSLEGDKINTGSYTEKRYGITFGGPIIKDTLFFFAAYEKLEGANLFDRGSIGSGAVNEINITQAELDEIAEIARTIYQYDPGPIPQSMPNEDEKFLLKLDWDISDQQWLFMGLQLPVAPTAIRLTARLDLISSPPSWISATMFWNRVSNAMVK